MQTTKGIVNKLQQELVAQYERTIDSMPFKPKQREDLKAGFRDGARAGIWHTLALLDVEVIE